MILTKWDSARDTYEEYGLPYTLVSLWVQNTGNLVVFAAAEAEHEKEKRQKISRYVGIPLIAAGLLCLACSRLFHFAIPGLLQSLVVVGLVAGYLIMDRGPSESEKAATQKVQDFRETVKWFADSLGIPVEELGQKSEQELDTFADRIMITKFRLALGYVRAPNEKVHMLSIIETALNRLSQFGLATKTLSYYYENGLSELKAQESPT